MGAHLSEPIREHVVEDDCDDEIRVGVSSMQGWRNSMEDSHCYDLNVGGNKHKLFAVFDGHGGREVAMFAAKELSRVLVESPEYKAGKYCEALRKSFLQIDEELRSASGKDFMKEHRDRAPRPLTQELKSIEEQIGVNVSRLVQRAQNEEGNAGCTAVAVLATEDTYYVANAGDSRASLCRGGTPIEFTLDHNPELQTEIDRIKNAGGTIERGRVMGNLNLTRALGDLTYKTNLELPAEEQVITANPDVSAHARHKDDEFLILACDGIWEARSSRDVQGFLKRRIDILNEKPLSSVGSSLCDALLSPNVALTDGIGCDNMTVMVIDLMKQRRDKTGKPPAPSQVHEAVQLNEEVGKDGSPLPTNGFADDDFSSAEIPCGGA